MLLCKQLEKLPGHRLPVYTSVLKKNVTQIQPAFTVILIHVKYLACIFKAKHRRYHETSSCGSYLPCYFPSESIIALNTLRVCQSKAEYAIGAFIPRLSETSAPQKSTGLSCGLVPPIELVCSSLKPSRATASNSPSSSDLLLDVVTTVGLCLSCWRFKGLLLLTM